MTKLEKLRMYQVSPAASYPFLVFSSFLRQKNVTFLPEETNANA